LILLEFCRPSFFFHLRSVFFLSIFFFPVCFKDRRFLLYLDMLVLSCQRYLFEGFFLPFFTGRPFASGPYSPSNHHREVVTRPPHPSFLGFNSPPPCSGSPFLPPRCISNLPFFPTFLFLKRLCDPPFLPLNLVPPKRRVYLRPGETLAKIILYSEHPFFIVPRRISGVFLPFTPYLLRFPSRFSDL